MAPVIWLPTLQPSLSSTRSPNSENDDTSSTQHGPLVAAIASFAMNASTTSAGGGQVMLIDVDDKGNRYCKRRGWKE